MSASVGTIVGLKSLSIPKKQRLIRSSIAICSHTASSSSETASGYSGTLAEVVFIVKSTEDAAPPSTGDTIPTGVFSKAKPERK